MIHEQQKFHESLRTPVEVPEGRLSDFRFPPVEKQERKIRSLVFESDQLIKGHVLASLESEPGAGPVTVLMEGPTAGVLARLRGVENVQRYEWECRRQVGQQAVAPSEYLGETLRCCLEKKTLCEVEAFSPEDRRALKALEREFRETLKEARTDLTLYPDLAISRVVVNHGLVVKTAMGKHYRLLVDIRNQDDHSMIFFDHRFEVFGPDQIRGIQRRDQLPNIDEPRSQPLAFMRIMNTSGSDTAFEWDVFLSRSAFDSAVKRLQSAPVPPQYSNEGDSLLMRLMRSSAVHALRSQDAAEIHAWQVESTGGTQNPLFKLETSAGRCTVRFKYDELRHYLSTGYGKPIQ